MGKPYKQRSKRASHPAISEYISEPIQTQQSESRHQILPGWERFWAIITACLAVYCAYVGFDFSFFPRQDIPDPNQDIKFSYLMFYFSGVFLLAFLSNIGKINLSALAIFVIGIFVMGLYGIVHGLLWSNNSIVKVISFFLAVTVFPSLIIGGIKLLISFRSMLLAARSGNDPIEAGEDTYTALSSKSWWHYAMYKNTQRKRR